jgi:Putative bacterial sensory transduction regulator
MVSPEAVGPDAVGPDAVGPRAVGPGAVGPGAVGPDAVGALIESTLDDRGVAWEKTGDGGYAATLPGTHKLTTVCNLIVGEHSVRVEAFVMRQPDERREELWAYLLQRNARMYGVAFAIDAVGDVYLTGRVALPAVTEEELDRLLGAVLTYADESFDTMLEIGFGSAIRREWAWRVSRGESLANLRAFAHIIEATPRAEG